MCMARGDSKWLDNVLRLSGRWTSRLIIESTYLKKFARLEKWKVCILEIMLPGHNMSWVITPEGKVGTTSFVQCV